MSDYEDQFRELVTSIAENWNRIMKTDPDNDLLIFWPILLGEAEWTEELKTEFRSRFNIASFNSELQCLQAYNEAITNARPRLKVV